MSTIANHSGNGLLYEIDGNAAEYGWGLTEDGKGIVIWNDTGFETLPANVQLQFSDKTVDTSVLFGEPSDDGPVHQLDGNSSDWGWGLTDDGKGIVVWSDTGFEILPANVQLQFADKTVDTSILFEEPSDEGPVHQLDGSSSDWGWGLTEDGKGIVVWNDSGFEILPAKVQLQFSDKTVDTSSLFDDPELNSVGGTVWFDDNQNGLRDDGEGGLAQMRVRLLDADNKLVAETLSDADGKYQFEDLAAGDYSISVWPAGIDGGFYHLTERVSGDANEAINSDVHVGRGTTDVFTLGDGNQSETLDAGLVFVDTYEPDPDAVLGSVGGTVWLDDNQNGLQDVGEGGLAHVRVQLRTADGRLLHETISDLDGNYMFEDREAGDYKVFFGDTGLFSFTEKDVAGNTADAADSDVDAVTAMTDVFTLGAGERNETLDAGLIVDTGPALAGDPDFTGAASALVNDEFDHIV